MPQSIARRPLPSKRGLILEATRTLMLRRGIDNFVMDDVAREAGVAKGTLFLYYKNKEDLFYSAIANLIDQFAQKLDALIAAETRDAVLLQETIRMILVYLDHNRDFVLQFGAGRYAGCGGRTHELLLGKFRENQRRLRQILARCEGAGVAKGRDPSYDGFALMGLCRSAMLEKFVSGSTRPLERETRKVMDFFLRGAGR